MANRTPALPADQAEPATLALQIEPEDFRQLLEDVQGSQQAVQALITLLGTSPPEERLTSLQPLGLAVLLENVAQRLELAAQALTVMPRRAPIGA